MLDVVAQQDFSAGAFDGDPTKVPPNGFSRAGNALIDSDGSLYRRGGSAFFPGGTWPSTQIVWTWQGALAGGLKTLAATASELFLVGGSGVTSLSGYTGMAAGPQTPAVMNGVMYLPGGNLTYDGTSLGSGAATELYYAVVANRLIAGGGSTVRFSAIGDPASFDPTDFWLIPGGASILGFAGLRDSCVVFTDRGTWVISNMSLNLTDADGNVQQRLDLYAPDLRLWGIGTAAVAGYAGGLIVPAQDGVWLMQLGITSEVAAPLTLLSRSIGTEYKARTRSTSGFAPGQAAVFQGHYLLPMPFGGHSVSDAIVCKLQPPDRYGNVPWTSIDSNTNAAYALTVSQDGKSLFGATVLPIGGGDSKLATMKYFDRSVSTKDADGSTPAFVVAMRSFLTGRLNENSIVKVRTRYFLDDSVDGGTPVMVADYSGLAFADFANLAGDAPVAQDGSFSWPVGQRARQAQFTFTVVDAGGVTLRSVEMFVRRSGRL